MEDYTWKDKNIALKEVKYMKYTMLGNSDLKVSKVCLGCMGFGDATKGMHSWAIFSFQTYNGHTGHEILLSFLIF